MLSIRSKVDTVTRARRPASTGRVADDRAQGSVNECVEDLSTLWHDGLLVLVGQHSREVQWVGVNAHPRQDVGSSSCPILIFTGRGDLVGKSRCDGGQKDDGGRTHVLFEG
jgi:hypothetical protein